MKTKRILLALLAALMSGALVGQSAAQITAVSNNIVAANTSGSAYYTLGSIDGLGGDLTIEGWVYLSSYANFGRIADLGNGDANGNIILGTVGTTGVPTFQLFDGATFLGAAAGPDPLALNTWVHVAGVVQADRTMRLYVNGNEVATSTATADAPTISRSSNFIAESNWAQDSVLNGAVSDVRIWNSARSQAEIQAAMPVGSIAGPTTGLVAAFPFGATGAAPTADVSGTGITASQVGTISYSKFDTGTLTTGGFNGADLNVAEGQLNLTGTNSVGRLSVNSATVTQAAGSSVTTTATGEPALQIGVSAGQNGSYTTSGGTLDVANSGMAFIGVSGNGSITQTGGAVSTGSWTVLGRFAGSTGSYDISGGTLSHSATEPGSKIIVGEEGTGTLTVSGSGAVSTVGGLSIAHQVGGVGTVNLDGGTITTSGVSKGSGTSANFNFNGGTLRATGNNNNFISGLDLVEIKAGGAVIDDGGFEIGVGPELFSGTGSLEKTGSGRVTLSGNNTYSGTTTISQGILRVGNDGTSGTLGSGDVINNATLAFARSDALTVSQAISGTGEVRKWGFGTTTFTGANTFSGDFLQEYGVTVLNRGGGPALYADGGPGEVVIANMAGGANFYSALEMGAADQLGANVDVTFSPIDIGSGFSYLSLHGNNTTIGNLKSTANYANAYGVVQNQESGSFGDSTLTIHQTVDGSFTGEIRNGFGDNVGRLALVKEGAATLTLNSAGGAGLSYTGGTTVNAGTLALGGNNGLADTGTVTVNAGSLDLGGFSDTVGTVTLAGGTIANGTLTGSSYNMRSGNVSAVLAGSSALTKSTAGTVTLTGNNTYTGGTTINNGTLVLAGGSDSQGSTATGPYTIGDGATLRVTAEGFWFNGTPSFNFTTNGGGTIDTAAGVNFIMGGDATFTSAGGARNEIAGSSGINLNLRTATLDVARGSDAESDLLVSSSFWNTGSLVKTGDGIATLSGNSSYTGTTTISAGTLQVGSGGTSGSLGTGNVTNNASLDFNRSDNHSVANTISGTGGVTKSGAGVTTLSGSNTYTGGTTINNGTLVLAGGSDSQGFTAAGPYTIGNGATLRVTAEGFWFNGTPSFNFTTNGGGTIDTAAGVNFIMGGDATFTSAGGARNEIAGSSGINLNLRTATLDVARGSDAETDLLVSSAFSNTGSLTKTGDGIATLSGNSSYTGTTTISAGTLQVGNGGTSGTLGTGNVTNNGTLAFNRSDNTTVGHAISGTGSVNKLGSGTMTLSGTSTYSGATAVNAGTLIVDGSADNSTVTVNSGATLSGSGSIGGLIVSSGGTINPGNSPGTQTVAGNATWNAGGNYNWQILDAAGSAGTGWDLLNVTGTLDLSPLSLGNEFEINLWSLSSIGPDVSGNALNFDSSQNYVWTIASAASGITGFTGSSQFSLNTGANNGTAGFANALNGGSFSIAQSGNDLNLVFTAAVVPPGPTPVPEPGTWVAAALLAAGAAYMRRRKGRQAQDQDGAMH